MIKLDFNVEIKSENAECLLNKAKQSNISGCPVSLGVATEAVIIAEQEAEERHEQQLQELRDRAVEAFKDVCSDGKCEDACGYCDKYHLFTQKLTEKQKKQ